MPYYIFALIAAAVAGAATAIGNLFNQYIVRRNEDRQTLHANLQAEQRLAAAEKVRKVEVAAEADKLRHKAGVDVLVAEGQKREARSEEERQRAEQVARDAMMREAKARKYAEEKGKEADAAKARVFDDFPEMDQTLPEMILAAKRKRGVHFDKQFNIAVIGLRGQGKSTLINAIRFDPGAATSVNECTHNRKGGLNDCYPHPGFPELVWHDLPGANTAVHPLRTYFQDQQLFVFDAFIICSSDTFSAAPDAHLTDVLTRQYQKPMAAVRTKCDVAVRSLTDPQICKFEGKAALPEKQAVQFVKESWSQVVQGALAEVAEKKLLSASERALHLQLVRTFVVSAHETFKDVSAAKEKGYDFDALGQWLLDVLPRELAALLKTRMEKGAARNYQDHMRPPPPTRPFSESAKLLRPHLDDHLDNKSTGDLIKYIRSKSYFSCKKPVLTGLSPEELKALAKDL